MLNPCTQHALDLFASLGKGTPKLISESRNEDSFGSGGTTLELDGLRLHVVNDRAIETVEVGLENVGEVLISTRPSTTIKMRWGSLRVPWNS